MASRLQELRKGKKLTQVALAEKAHVARSVIARFETGRTVMSTKNLTSICRVLGCRIEDILGGDADGKAV